MRARNVRSAWSAWSAPSGRARRARRAAGSLGPPLRAGHRPVSSGHARSFPPPQPDRRRDVRGGASFMGAAEPGAPIRLIAPFRRAAASHRRARGREKLSQRLGQPVIVEKKPGAGTTIGTEAAAKSAADGYTLLVGPIGSQAVVHRMHPKRGFDISAISLRCCASATGPSCRRARRLGAASVKDSSRWRRQAREYTFASGRRRADPPHRRDVPAGRGDRVAHVPYKGSTEILPDLLDGRVDMALDSLPA